MKKLLLMLTLYVSAMCASAQEWIFAAESEDAKFYINETLRKRGANYVVFQKNIPKDLSKERRRMAENFGESKWYRYAYNIVTLLADIDAYRTKWLNITYYDISDNVLLNSDCSDMDWAFAPPNTIAEGICDAVIGIVNGSAAPASPSLYTGREVGWRNRSIPTQFRTSESTHSVMKMTMEWP